MVVQKGFLENSFERLGQVRCELSNNHDLVHCLGCISAACVAWAAAKTAQTLKCPRETNKVSALNSGLIYESRGIELIPDGPDIPPSLFFFLLLLLRSSSNLGRPVSQSQRTDSGHLACLSGRTLAWSLRIPTERLTARIRQVLLYSSLPSRA